MSTAVRIEAAPGPVFPGPNVFAAIDEKALWRGDRLTGAPLRIYLEAGYGDTFQCVRFLRPFLAWADGPVTFVCCRQLAPLLRQSFPEADIQTDHPLPQARWAIGAMRTGPPTWWSICAHELRFAPARPPYLTAERPRQFACDARHAGICWAGDAAGKAWDRYRSIHDVATLAPLWAVPGIVWHSLVVDRPPPHPCVVDHRVSLRDWIAAANLIGGLDLVVSVDTAVAHLAGALDVATWLLVRPAWPVGALTDDMLNDPTLGDPRWEPLTYGLGRRVEAEAGRLYASERLFHQPAPGEWAPVVAQVAAALWKAWPDFQL